MQRSLCLLSAAAAAVATAHAQQDPLEEIVVTASFREAQLLSLPLSATVLDSAALRRNAVQHFEEVIRQVPNLNLSGEGSRARYFQLRGIGELEQYEGSPNPSVGFIVDDIDFSGLGSIGTLFDVDRVEVLRGPQGTRYGANALGGLIYLTSRSPGESFEGELEAVGGSNGARALGAAAGGPLSDSLGWRGSLHGYESNGFRQNVFLGRDDTYGRDEVSAHGKLVWSPSDRTRVDFSGLYVDLDNGYDAWAIDNGFNTYSDEPGRDAQRSAAGSVRVSTELRAFDLVSITSAADTDARFSFDADWGNAAYWAPYVYDYFSSNERERRTYTQELRLLSKPGALGSGRGDWLAGVYFLDLDERNDALNTGVYDDDVFCDPCTLDTVGTSRYDARNVAVFGQLDFALAERLGFTAGVRFERRDASFADTAGNVFAPDDQMVGGELALTRQLRPGRSVYVRLARGYKGGGFNVALAGIDFADVDAPLSPDEIEFDPERLTSIEAGWRAQSSEGTWSVDVGVFAARRNDQQIKVPMQLRFGDPSSFLFVTANSERGEHRGVEASVDWQPLERWRLNAALGWLDASIERFSLFPELEGREPAHAPAYTYALGAEYRGPAGWHGTVDVTGMDDFYFDYGHDQRSERYALVNLQVGREWGPWGVSLWSRNARDERYAVRGFFFGNEPPDFADELYTRLGDPRQYGVTLQYRW